MPETLRTGLSDVINSLNKVRNNTADVAEADEIQKVLRALNALWEEVIRQEINNETKAYARALEALGEADASAREALDDLGKTAKAIKTAVKAAKAVDKIVKLVADVFL